MRDKAVTERADGHGGKGQLYHRFLKISKRRRERHRAKRNPLCVPMYGKYRGYEM